VTNFRPALELELRSFLHTTDMSNPFKPTPPERGSRMFNPVIDPKPTPVVPPTIMTSDVSPTGIPVLPAWLVRWMAPVLLAAGAVYVEKDELLALGVPPGVIKFAAIVAIVAGPVLAVMSPGLRKRKKKK
jgi:hypothetical protein